MKLTFAETTEKRDLLAQSPIAIEIIIPADKCPEEILANPFELLSSGHPESKLFTA
jgi:hypothetical protein